MISEFAKAKINLTLQVLGRRPDGYHELVSLVAFADVGDTITLTPQAAAGFDTDGPFATAIDGENLIEKTLRLVAERAPAFQPGHVRLTKNLPVAAGLGGGSADAAALLRALLRADATLAAQLDTPMLARQLGADVTVCLGQRTALMWGIGEHVAPLPALPPCWVVLGNPGVPLSTADVFRTLSARPLAAASAPPTLPSAFQTLGDLAAYLRAAGNDMQATARRLCPPIDAILAALHDCADCAYTAQSGSGPTCFGLFATESQAHAAADRIAARDPRWWVAAGQIQ